ncbi:nucleotidyltransferase family protein [Terasakiella sp. A23]|uniref:nucleotidyltransferase family protein n=1 Tax=Terasakiella sp. FCG-A23 TaxID=3080561 RepID=UPI002952AA84|nr:nucleotidyltransferase family protein [Terasakiella sp. A23]MDV7341262.1 nucleotidyltransferase family protein [Terasakiella sp. A23]
MMKLACIMLAAGRGSRFGGKKQLARIDGQAMVARSLGEVQPLFPNDTYVVLGAYEDQVRSVLPAACRVLHHQNWADGLGASLAFGMKALEGYDGVLVTLADQVALKQADFERMIDPFDGTSIVSAHYKDKHAVPTLFPASFFDQLKGLSGDRGAQKLLKENLDRIVSVKMACAAIDIDTQDDLLEYGKRHHDAA